MSHGHKQPIHIAAKKVPTGVQDKYEKLLKAHYPTAHIVCLWRGKDRYELICTFDKGLPIAYMMREEAERYVFTAAGYTDIIIAKETVS